MVKRYHIFLIMIFAFLGIILAGALTLAKYTDSVAVICGEEVDSSCNVVQNSDYAYLINVKDDEGVSKFQVPLSLGGMFFYCVLFIISTVLFVHYDKRELKQLKYFLFFVGLIGICFSITYTWIQAYKIKAFCTYCLISAFDSLVMFILITFIAFEDKFKKILEKNKKQKASKN